jgi:glyoxylase-like metal-dependent hydrolase (beta-lactamase superfamily II)
VTAKIYFFPVNNGDMTLIKLDSGRTILIDVKICTAADDTKDATPDVAFKLRERLQKDQKGRYYVDVFLLTHPDEDHCLGLSKHFHLGSPDDYGKKKDDKILIREIWSSPIIFRRKERRAKAESIVLCKDAQDFWAEARRRVTYFREHGTSEIGDGNRILILGEDEDGKTDNLLDIVVKIDELITKVNGVQDSSVRDKKLEKMSRIGFHQNYHNPQKPYEPL